MFVCVCVQLFAGFFNVLLLPFTKIECQINQLPLGSFGKIYEKTLVCDFATFGSVM